MGIFEPLIEHSDGRPSEPRHRRDVVAPILVLLAVCLLAVVVLVWGG
jgi:formate-dependent nitrite reductase membrane component NrfD